MGIKSIFEFYEENVKGTGQKEYVKEGQFFIGDIPSRLRKKLKIKYSKIYITSKSLKHIYDRHCFDKKQIETPDEIIKNLDLITTNPLFVCINKSKNKRADYLFVAEIDGRQFICPVESSRTRKGKKLIDIFCVVSGFKSKEGYIKDVEIVYKKSDKLRGTEGGASSS